MLLLGRVAFLQLFQLTLGFMFADVSWRVS